MDKLLTDIDLCEALSDLFIDREDNYPYIASIAQYFPINHVENVLFSWVAPVCYTNLVAPIPSVWMGFDKNELWKDIQQYRVKNNTKSFYIKIRNFFLFWYLRKLLKSQWIELKKHIKELKKKNNIII